MRRQVHVITPGDHFSPLTGSATSTVVHGICKHLPTGLPRPAVLVAKGTYAARYPSADVIEYYPQRPSHLMRKFPPSLIDAVLGQLRLPRVVARRPFIPALKMQHRWEPADVVLHNAPAAVYLVDRTKHRPVLYLHNEVFRTYRTEEVCRLVENAHRVVCVSDYIKTRLTRRLPERLHDRCVTVLNGVDHGSFYPDKACRAVNYLRVGFLGRIHPDKGVDILLNAVRRMRTASFEVQILGSSGFDAADPLTSYERSLRAAAHDLPVEFLPFRPREQVAKILRGWDIAVVPSRWAEPAGLTTLEAMASGAALVASRVGGIPEMVGNGGVLVPPGDPNTLSEVLDHLVRDSTFRTGVANAGLRRAAELSWKHQSAALATVLCGRNE